MNRRSFLIKTITGLIAAPFVAIIPKRVMAKRGSIPSKQLIPDIETVIPIRSSDTFSHYEVWRSIDGINYELVLSSAEYPLIYADDRIDERYYSVDVYGRRKLISY